MERAPAAYDEAAISEVAGAVLAQLPNPWAAGRPFTIQEWTRRATRSVNPFVRSRRKKRVEPLLPTPEQLLAARHLPQWNSVRDGWACPCCKRTKEKTVHVTKEGKPHFYTERVSAWKVYGRSLIICADCDVVRRKLLREAGARWTHVDLPHVQDVIRPRDHLSHDVVQDREWVIGEIQRKSEWAV